MFSLLFRNRWFALGWVALTLLSASLFVGKDGGADMIARSTERIEEQRRALSAAPPPSAAPDAAAEVPVLEALPGKPGDPASPQVGDVFVDPATGLRLRAVRRSDYEAGAYSSSADSP